MSQPPTSHSAIKAWFLCPRLYRYTYVDRRVPISEAPELGFGKAFHKCIETGSDKPISENNSLPKTWKIVGEALLWGYRNHYAKDKHTPGQREVPFYIDYLSLRVRGFFDGVGDKFLYELKTTGSRLDTHDAPYFQRLQRDQQVSIYLWAARELGMEIDYMLYDIVRRPSLRFRRGESEQQFRTRVEDYIMDNRDTVYVRKQLTRTDEQLDMVQQNLYDVRHLMGNLVYPENTSNCYAFNRQCSYFGVCSGVESLDNDQLFRTKDDR